MSRYYRLYCVLLAAALIVAGICSPGCCASKGTVGKGYSVITDKNELKSLYYSQAHMAMPECFRFTIFEDSKRSGAFLLSGNFWILGSKGCDRYSFEDVPIDRRVLEEIRAILIKHKLAALRRGSAQYKLNESKEAARKEFLIKNEVRDYTSTSFEIEFDDDLVIDDMDDAPALTAAMRDIRDYLTKLGKRVSKRAKP